MEPSVKNIKRGFTLVEMIVGVALIVIAVVGGTGTLFSSIKNKKKIENLTLIKQNGNHALNIMSNKIRNATDINTCNIGGLIDTVEIENPSTEATTTTTYICNANNGSNFISVDGNDLISDNVTACNFSCTLSDTEPDYIIIAFTLAVDSGPVYGMVSQNFQQSISLRNY